MLGDYFLEILSNHGPETPACNPVPVKQGDISSKISGRGKIIPNRMVDVESRKRGTIQEILVKEGEQVVKGQRLVRIEPEPSFTIELDRIRENIYNVREEKKDFEKKLEKNRKLYKEGIIALREVEESEKALSRVTTRINMLKRQLKTLSKESGQKINDSINENSSNKDDHIYIRAPFSGTILQINRHLGDIVTPESPSQPYMENKGILILADLSEYLVEHKVSEIDIDKIQVGKAAEVWLESFPKKVYHGIIHTISSISTTPKINFPREKEGLSYFNIKILIKDAGPELKIGMSCKVSIIFNEKRGVLLAPVEAVAKDNGEDFVYIMRSDSFYRQKVTTGVFNEHYIEITSDLTEGVLLCSRPLVILEWEELRRIDQERSFIEKILN